MRNRLILRLNPLIALLLSVAIVVSFGGCGGRPNTAQSESEVATLQSESEEATLQSESEEATFYTDDFTLPDMTEPAEPEVMPEEVPAEVYVSDAFSDYKPNDRGLINNYRIPKVNIAGEEAEKTNAVIYNDLYHGVYEDIEEPGEYCGSSGITYIWAENNGVISIIVEWMPEDFTSHGPTYIKTYNISAETGALLTKEEIIAAYGFTMEAFYDLAKEKILRKYEEWNQELSVYEKFKSDYEKYLNKAISKESLENMRVFVSDGGDLVVYADFIYIMTYDRITVTINMTGDTMPKYPEFSWDMPE